MIFDFDFDFYIYIAYNDIRCCRVIYKDIGTGIVVSESPLSRYTFHIYLLLLLFWLLDNKSQMS